MASVVASMKGSGSTPTYDDGRKCNDDGEETKPWEKTFERTKFQSPILLSTAILNSMSAKIN